MNEGRLVYASAGHLPILVRDENGTIHRGDEPTGPPHRHGGWLRASGAVPLGPGSTAVMYTDGLVERRDEDIDAAWLRSSTPSRARPARPRSSADRLIESGGRHRRPRRRRGGPGPPAPGAQGLRRRTVPQRRAGTPRRRRGRPRAPAPSPPASCPVGASPRNSRPWASWRPANSSPTRSSTAPRRCG
ncbi:SpoIIE family protein phosphatase [Streptomyces sp. KL116D]|uniref:SpoIIE family protein phosphatase n=1 Tax=Streptomyces sp. KL116D TaxID=3045152 RepID=UPI003558E544